MTVVAVVVVVMVVAVAVVVVVRAGDILNYLILMYLYCWCFVASFIGH